MAASGPCWARPQALFFGLNGYGGVLNTFALIQHPAGTGAACSTSGLSLTQSIGNGHLLEITTITANNVTLTGIGSGGSFVHCTNCHGGNATVGFLDAGYVLSSTATAGPVSFSFSSSSGTVYACSIREYSFTLGSTSLDTSASTFLGSGGSPPCYGQALTLGGTNDVIVQVGSFTTSVSAISSPYGHLDIESGAGFAENLNTSSGAKPTWTTTGCAAQGYFGIAFK